MKSTELVLKTALRTLDIEQLTLLDLKESINDFFCKGVEAVFASKGRLIITGIGKSALVGQKIVATLNSTGTAALFMHAADAIHGDLGMIQSDDMVLCISKSGNTPEIKVLVPFLKRLGNQVIGMVANPDSYLGKHCDFLFHTPIRQEADPNNLAPTASTTAQMALGDAMATALLALRGFTPNDFAKYHPGGALGKQLYLKVEEVFLNNEKPAVLPNATLREIIVEMTSKRLGATAVVDETQKLLGIITDGDLRRMLEKEEDVSTLNAKEIMTPNPKSVTAATLAMKALQMMRKFSITQLVVVQGEQYLGILHLHDLLREGLV